MKKSVSSAQGKNSSRSASQKSSGSRSASSSSSPAPRSSSSQGAKGSSSSGQSAKGGSSSQNAKGGSSSNQGSKGGSASASKGSSAAGSASRGNSSKKQSSTSSKLQELMIDEIKDIFWAEQALLKALPKMAKKATSPELKQALENHLEETRGQIERLEQVFELLGVPAKAKKCEAMAGLVKEAGEIMEDTDAGVMRDAGIISAGQKVEHYEIATYGTLRTFAQTLGLTEVAALLQETLDEEKAADEKLTEVAESAINIEAAEE